MDSTVVQVCMSLLREELLGNFLFLTNMFSSSSWDRMYVIAGILLCFWSVKRESQWRSYATLLSLCQTRFSQY